MGAFAMLIIWVFLSVMVGIAATEKNRSFACFFLVSLFLSPLIGGFMLLVFGEKK